MRKFKKFFYFCSVVCFCFYFSGLVSAKKCVINLLIVGDKGVGKTTLMRRLCDGSIFNRFNNIYYELLYEEEVLFPITNKEINRCEVVNYDHCRGDDFELRIIEANTNDPKIDLLYKNATIIFCVFDITKFPSLQEIKAWYEKIMFIKTGRRFESDILNWTNEEWNKWYENVSDTFQDCSIDFTANKCDLIENFDSSHDERMIFLRRLPNAGRGIASSFLGRGMRELLIKGIFDPGNGGTFNLKINDPREEFFSIAEAENVTKSQRHRQQNYSNDQEPSKGCIIL